MVLMETQWLTATALCFHCGRVWQAVFPEDTNVATLECGKCGKQDSITVDIQ